MNKKKKEEDGRKTRKTEKRQKCRDAGSGFSSTQSCTLITSYHYFFLCSCISVTSKALANNVKIVRMLFWLMSRLIFYFFFEFHCSRLFSSISWSNMRAQPDRFEISKSNLSGKF